MLYLIGDDSPHGAGIVDLVSAQVWDRVADLMLAANRTESLARPVADLERAYYDARFVLTRELSPLAPSPGRTIAQEIGAA